MQIASRTAHIAVLLTGIAALSLTSVAGRGEPVLNQVLSGAKVIAVRSEGCATLRIGFNFRVQYLSHFPTGGGRELRIKIEPIDARGARQNITTARESVRAPDLSGIPLRGIEFEANGSGPLLVLYFDEQVNFDVAQGEDFTSVIVRLAGQTAGASCKDKFSLRPAVDAPQAAASDQASGEEPASDAAKLDRTIANARAAIARQDLGRATQLLTKLVSLPLHAHSAEAQELLGVVREKRGQMAHAKAEYEAYLKAYPSGEGANRVRQRLAAIITAESEPPAKLRKADGVRTADAQAAGNAPGEAPVAAAAQSGTSTSVAAEEEQEAEEDPSVFEWNVTGSLSQFYFRNQEFTRFTELESRRVTEDDDIFQNSLLTSLDLVATAENDAYRFKSRFSGAHDADFTDDTEHDYRVSAAFAEIELKEPGLTGRLGRQTRNSGGLLGRFDGGLLSWQANETMRINLASGSPVDSSRDAPFERDRYFFGASVDFEEIFGGFDLTLFGVEQRADGLVDRRAIGAEISYADATKSMFASIDYDIYFNQVSRALLSGSYTFADESTLSASLDYVNSPTLATSNALQGQPVDDLDALRQLFTVSEIKELARDRTTESESFNIAYTRPLNETWQATVDGTVFYTEGNPASGGVEAIEAPGTEYFTSAQLVGTSVFKEGDIVSGTLRYADTASSILYLLDAYVRYPVTRELRLRPRLKLGYREFTRSPGDELFAIPSLTANYAWTKNTSFEVELGGRWSDRDTLTASERAQEIYIIAGYRYDF